MKVEASELENIFPVKFWQVDSRDNILFLSNQNFI